MNLQYDGSLIDLSKRTKNLSVEEDKLIVSAWLNTSNMQLLGMNNKVVHSGKEYCNTWNFMEAIMKSVLNLLLKDVGLI